MNLMRRGFTLLELLIVVIIVGIAAGLAVSRFQRMIECNYQRAAIKTLRSIVVAERQYLMEKGHFTDQFADLPITDPNAQSAEHPVTYDTRLTDTTPQNPLFVGRATWVGHNRTLLLIYRPTVTTGDPPGEALQFPEPVWCP